ncbi:MAG: hypothetical protein QHC91_00295 [Shinella sp.]|nr:hypothetical protein [Shinella sp.]
MVFHQLDRVENGPADVGRLAVSIPIAGRHVALAACEYSRLLRDCAGVL